MVSTATRRGQWEGLVPGASKIAVTGVAGVIGQLLSRALRREGFDVVGIDKSTPTLQNQPEPTVVSPSSVFLSSSSSSATVSTSASDLVDRIFHFGEVPAHEHGSTNPFADCDAVIHLSAIGDPTASYSKLLAPNIAGTSCRLVFTFLR